MTSRRILLIPLVLSALLAAAPAIAAATVQLELVGDPEGSGLLFQDWGQTLSKAGIKGFRLRSATETDKVGIETRGAGDGLVYVVTGIVLSRDELLLPGGRFRRGDMARLSQWLKDLAQHGPSAGKEEKAEFGLSSAQFQQVRSDLATPVDSATQGLPRRQVVQAIAARLNLPLKLDAEAAQALADDKVEEDLSGLTCGTALACLLRPAGYCLAPRATGTELAYAVVKAQPKLEVWPVGWKPEKPDKDSLPALFEFRDVNVQNVSAATVLEAIAKQVKAPALLDHNALRTTASIRPRRWLRSPAAEQSTWWPCESCLFQAGMKFEVRCDEAGTPFLWITSLKPV